MFGLDYCPHISLFQVKTYSVSREWFIDNVGKNFGNLDCILCLLTRDQGDSMANIGRRKLEQAAFSGLLKVRIPFGAMYKDGRDMMTSGRYNRMSKVARIKYREDSGFLRRKERLHDDSS